MKVSRYLGSDRSWIERLGFANFDFVLFGDSYISTLGVFNVWVLSFQAEKPSSGRLLANF